MGALAHHLYNQLWLSESANKLNTIPFFVESWEQLKPDLLLGYIHHFRSALLVVSSWMKACSWKGIILWLPLWVGVSLLNFGDYCFRAYPIGDYPCKTKSAAAIMLMIMNNLDPSVAQVRHSENEDTGFIEQQQICRIFPVCTRTYHLKNSCVWVIVIHVQMILLP